MVEFVWCQTVWKGTQCDVKLSLIKLSWIQFVKLNLVEISASWKTLSWINCSEDEKVSTRSHIPRGSSLCPWQLLAATPEQQSASTSSYTNLDSRLALASSTAVADFLWHCWVSHCWMMKRSIYLFGETDQFIRNYKHCYSAASYGCGIFWSIPCCWLSYTLSYPQVHTCSLWNTSCTSNTLLRRCGSRMDTDLRTVC